MGPDRRDGPATALFDAVTGRVGADSARRTELAGLAGLEREFEPVLLEP